MMEIDEEFGKVYGDRVTDDEERWFVGFLDRRKRLKVFFLIGESLRGFCRAREFESEWNFHQNGR
ncbi:hypothetical protein LINGRAHAP2_LOCUS31321 [Linum grandiflorum]